MTFWNVHNFALPSVSLEPINTLLSEDLRRARAQLMFYTVSVAGDFNFVMPQDRIFRPIDAARMGGEAEMPAADSTDMLARSFAWYYY